MKRKVVKRNPFNSIQFSVWAGFFLLITLFCTSDSNIKVQSKEHSSNEFASSFINSDFTSEACEESENEGEEESLEFFLCLKKIAWKNLKQNLYTKENIFSQTHVRPDYKTIKTTYLLC